MVGITVTLINKVKSGTDAFNHDIYELIVDDVHNVLVAPTTADDVISSVDLSGKKEVLTLGIPKGDEHDWTDCEVIVFGKKYKSFGPVIRGIEQNVPTKWHKKVMVELYE